MKSDLSIDEENIVIDPADHNYKPPPFEHLKEQLEGAFWDSARKYGRIFYDVGAAVYFVNDDQARSYAHLLKRMDALYQDMFKVSGFPQWPTTAGQIEFPLSFGFLVVLIRWKKEDGSGLWFDYEQYKNNNYPCASP